MRRSHSAPNTSRHASMPSVSKRAPSRVSSTPNPRSAMTVSVDAHVVQSTQRPNRSAPRPRASTSDRPKPIAARARFDPRNAALSLKILENGFIAPRTPGSAIGQPAIRRTSPDSPSFGAVIDTQRPRPDAPASKTRRQIGIADQRTSAHDHQPKIAPLRLEQRRRRRRPPAAARRSGLPAPRTQAVRPAADAAAQRPSVVTIPSSSAARHREDAARRASRRADRARR